MRKTFTIIALLAVAATACNKMEIDPNNGGLTPAGNMITETVSATTGEKQTKAEIADDAKFSWSVNDQVAAHADDGKYYISDALKTEDIDGTDPAKANFTVTHDGTRDAFAIYPASIVAADAANYGQSGSSLDVTLPSSYILAQVSGAVTPCPMIATNAPEAGWEFKQLCGLLRLTVSNIPASTKRLEINFDGKKVAGDFAIPDPVKSDGTSAIALSNASGSNSTTITITNDGATDVTLGKTELVLNIPLPTGTYSGITITAYDALTAGNIVLSTSSAFAYSATQARGTRRAAIFPGVISVSATKKVVFAPGNLQYLGNADGTGTWRFAEHQYDFMGDGPASGSSFQGNVTVAGYTKYNASADKDVARDLFGWGASGYNGKYPYLTSTNSGSYYNGSLTDTDYDWGVYHSELGNSTEKITNGGDYSWRLFTAQEWSYAVKRQGKVYTRPDVPTYRETKDLFASATVMGVKGIILFPDNWDGSSDRTIQYGNASSAGYGKTIRDAEQWAVLEKAGCVFLPAAHVRSGASMDYLNEGHYWAGTVFSVLNNKEFRGGTFEFSASGTITKSSSNDRVRRLGQSVRLIRDVE